MVTIGTFSCRVESLGSPLEGCHEMAGWNFVNHPPHPSHLPRRGEGDVYVFIETGYALK